MKAGLGHPWAIVWHEPSFLVSRAIRHLFYLLIRNFENKTIILIICSFFLLSLSRVVKHSPIPLTNMPFFCCSMCCLAVISQTTKTEWGWRFLILAVVAWSFGISSYDGTASWGCARLQPSLLVIVSILILNDFLNTYSPN